MRNPDRLSGLFFILFSIAMCALSLRLPRGTLGTPGPIVFPLLLSLSLLAFSLFLFVRSKPSLLSSYFDIFPKAEVLKVIYVLGTFFLSILIFELMGFVISIFVLLALLFRGIGAKTILQSFVYGLIISLAAYFCFQSLLNMPLPKGILWF